MFNATIRIRKEYAKYNFDNGDVVEVEGIRVILSPKIEKFIQLRNLTSGTKSNLELLEYCNPSLAQWFHNVSVGCEMVLKETASKKIEVSESNSIKEIYSNSETDNSL